MKDKIKFVKSIKMFGEKELGLFFDGSFVKLAKNEFSCNWVYACYKNRMQSALKDNFPYEFHSDMNKALKRQKALDKKGLDTYFYHAEAHGGKKCPITKEMLESDRARQCYVVLHEAWHATSSRNEHNFPYSFEESSGRVVGLFGGIEFARYINDDELVRTTTDQEKAWSMFADFINVSYKKLNDLMKKDASESEIAELKKKLNIKAEKLYNILPDSWEKIELKKEINNAYILRYYDYTVHYSLAKSIFIKTGALQKTMKLYSELFKNASDEKSVKKVIRELKKEYL